MIKAIIFDMDGTLVEYGIGEKPDILSNKPGFYFSKLPIECMLNRAEALSKLPNVVVGVLSNCYYAEQREDKLNWLDKFAGFMDKLHRHIIVFDEMDFLPEEKDFLKVNKMQTIQGFLKIYLIEDNHNIISATNKIIPGSSHHLSRLLV